MRSTYYEFRDILYINRRINKSRFGKPVFLMYCVNSNGMNNMISFSLLENENTDGFKYPLEKLKEFAYKAPKICIIERNLNLTKAI